MISEVSDERSITILRKTVSAMRKISTNITILASSRRLSLQTINSTSSALSSVEFDGLFFTKFNFLSSRSEICYQVSARPLYLALKDYQEPTHFSLSIDEGRHLLCISTKDRMGIKHEVELYLEDGTALKVKTNEINPTVSLSIRPSIITTIDSVFKGIDNISIMFSRNSDGMSILLKPFEADLTQSVSQLRLFQSDEISLKILNSKETLLIFSNKDFKAGMKIGSVISNSIIIEGTEQGEPVFIRAKMANTVEFEQAMATFFENGTSSQDVETVPIKIDEHDEKEEKRPQKDIQHKEVERTTQSAAGSMNYGETQYVPWPFQVSEANQDIEKRRSD